MQGDATVSSEFTAGSPQSALQSPLTRDGAIAGTPGYMSPEQARGAAVDARSDQFSFCVALYEALYRQPPFVSRDLADALNPGRPRPPPARSPVPVEVFQALSRGLATEPVARFPSVAELIAALTPSSVREGAAARTGRQFVAGAALLLVLVSSALMLAKQKSSPLQLEDLTGLSAFMLVLIATTAFVLRRKLRSNALNTDIVVRMLCFALISVALRSMGLCLHLDLKTFLPIDLVVAGGLTTSFAYPHLPLLWAVALGYEIAAVMAARWPQYGTPVANLAYTALAIGACYAWARAARRPTAGPR